MAFRLAVAGGKGGVGKTTVAVNLAAALADSGLKVLLVDADVDNPNDHLNLGLEVEKLRDITSFAPTIDPAACTKCGTCAAKCPEHALLARPGKEPIFFSDRCSGCRICKLVCPADAISDGEKVLGYLFSASEGNLYLVGAELRPGEARSPLVVGALMDFVDELVSSRDFDLVITDCPPGAGNTVVRAMMGAQLAILITEPTPFGLNTLKLAVKVVRALGLKACLVINRADISPQGLGAVKSLAAVEELEVLAELPFDEVAVEASVKGKPLVRAAPDSKVGRALLSLAEWLKAFLRSRPGRPKA